MPPSLGTYSKHRLITVFATKLQTIFNPTNKNRKKMEELKNYLQKEFDRSVHRKYRHLFEQWFANLTDNQIMYYKAYMRGKKSPFV